MTALTHILAVYGALSAVAMLAGAVLAWRHWRASRHTAGVEDGRARQNDLTAVADAVTEPRAVLTVHRLHTGALDYSTSELTAGEAMTVAERLFRAALAAQYREAGMCEAETYANGEQP